MINENSLDEFKIGNSPIKVKVKARLHTRVILCNIGEVLYFGKC